MVAGAGIEVFGKCCADKGRASPRLRGFKERFLKEVTFEGAVSRRNEVSRVKDAGREFPAATGVDRVTKMPTVCP